MNSLGSNILYVFLTGETCSLANPARHGGVAHETRPSSVSIWSRVSIWYRRRGSRGIRKVAEHFAGDFAPDAVQAADLRERAIGWGASQGPEKALSVGIVLIQPQ